MNLLAVPGVVGVDVMPATLGSALERVDGLAGAVLDTSPARPGDVLVIISLSGRNALPVEMAMNARALGLKVIGVTSVAYATGDQVAARLGHLPQGPLRRRPRLARSPSATRSSPSTASTRPSPPRPRSSPARSCRPSWRRPPASSPTAGIEPPLLRSGNVDGGHEWNGRVMHGVRRPDLLPALTGRQQPGVGRRGRLGRTGDRQGRAVTRTSARPP